MFAGDVVRRNVNECREHGCCDTPFLGGRCRDHHEQKVKEEERRKAALRALHEGEIDGEPPRNRELRNELFRLRHWWHRACDALRYGREDELIGDEGEYAAEWCILLAQEIVDAELAFRRGGTPPTSLESTREWVWERFGNLQAGLRSNSTPRHD